MKTNLGTVFVLVAIAASPLGAQEPDSAVSEDPPPEATLADVEWMIGKWEGVDSDGDRTVERWLAPIGKTMVGTFVQTKRDENAQVQVDWAEHMHLREEGGTLILNSLTMQSGAETEDPLPFRKPLLEMSPCHIVFENLQIACSEPSNPGAGLVVTYGEDFMNDGTGVYTIQYKRAGNE